MCMDFGRLKDISKVDFSLPGEDQYSKLMFRNHPNFVNSFTFRLGAPAWSCADWKGKIYPDKAQAPTFLHYYAQHFDTIELNSTHYGIPKENTLIKWRSTVGDNFRFSPKFLQSVSHRKRLKNSKDDVLEFTDQMLALGGNLGYSWVQLPPDFTTKEASALFQFLDLFPKNYKLGVELRHPSWFTDEVMLNTLSEILTDKGYALVITDVAGRRDVLHMRVTTPVLMVRFVGNELHQTDFKRVNDWRERIASFKRQGLQEVYFFGHQPEDILCPELGNYIGKDFTKHQISDFNYPIIREKIEQQSLF
ncbi:DUF72 domain-containing protein [Flammeovirga pectinis]|uniref:DUF72 domain-containing protein n=1 Tax=Flammeovirga pectinis TaxID=2494373 RepID=A0A3Q9FLL6_9BACT|nr:DUF72 domain-containing protein [Flammeovirga pectinis]AZQ62456.1 DUF72 domain-containing protein [Flammeovirga pectinis]